jgi:hypothetical protein
VCLRGFASQTGSDSKGLYLQKKPLGVFGPGYFPASEEGSSLFTSLFTSLRVRVQSYVTVMSLSTRHFAPNTLTRHLPR